MLNLVDFDMKNEFKTVSQLLKLNYEKLEDVEKNY